MTIIITIIVFFFFYPTQGPSEADWTTKNLPASPTPASIAILLLLRLGGMRREDRP